MSQPRRLFLPALLGLLLFPACTSCPEKVDDDHRHVFEAEEERLDQLVRHEAAPAGERRRTS